MTRNKQLKDEAHRYAAEHGLSYADARRRLLNQRRAATPRPEPTPAQPDNTGLWFSSEKTP